MNNLNQIGIACHAYHDVHETLPLGFFNSNDSRQLLRDKCSGDADQSWLVRILLFIEQKPLYDSINQQTWICGYENWTSIATVISTYTCPAEPDVGQKIPLIQAILKRNGFPVTGAPPVSWSSSYAALSGTTDVYTGPSEKYNCQVPTPLLQSFNGAMSWQMIRFQNITDGLSTTVFGGERAVNNINGRLNFGQWYQSGFLCSVATSMQPPNYFNSVRNDPKQSNLAQVQIPINLNGYHPGGVNTLFCDGSVRFIKSSVQSWPVDPTSFWPAGSTQDNTLYFYTNLPKPGVWQALSTRAGGEVISAGDY